MGISMGILMLVWEFYNLSQRTKLDTLLLKIQSFDITTNIKKLQQTFVFYISFNISMWQQGFTHVVSETIAVFLSIVVMHEEHRKEKGPTKS